MFLLENVVFKDILHIDSLTIDSEHLTAIVGPSGGGKTTLLKLLNGMISPDSGKIYYKGKNLEEIDLVKHRQEVIMLQQVPTLFPGSIKDNLLIGFRFANKKEPEKQRLLDVLLQMQLEKSLDDDPKTLSQGEKQRLVLARALLLEPEVLLLDEPSSSLDEQTKREIIKSVASHIKEQNRTCIMVTHSNELAKNYGEYILEVSHKTVKKLKGSL